MQNPPYINLLNLDSVALSSLVKRLGGKPFCARQLKRWVHQKKLSAFESMTDLKNDFRKELSRNCIVQVPPVMMEKHATDGTLKWLFDIGEGNVIETVFIPEANRGTLCVSSQAGCAVKCSFCSTGHQGFSRNLQTSEIIGQLWEADRILSNKQTVTRLHHNLAESPHHNISNVVMMGMGEPLLNYRSVVTSLQLMLDDDAYGLSRRRVTLSTSGVVPMIDRLSCECPVSLAVSLHAPNDELRNKLVPLNKKYPLKELLFACNRYLAHSPRDFITFEYVMLQGINDLDQHLEELTKISSHVRCKLNLIPFNSFPGSELRCSAPQRIEEFSRHLKEEGVFVTVRKTRGSDIDAACGQLAGKVQDITRVRERDRVPHRFISLRECRQYDPQFNKSNTT